MDELIRQPVAAAARVVSGDGRILPIEVGADGTLTLPPGIASGILEIETADHEPMTVALPFTGAAIALRRDAALRGVVLSDGTPLRGASVKLFKLPPPLLGGSRMAPPKSPVAETRSGFSGRFRFPGLAAAQYLYEVASPGEVTVRIPGANRPGRNRPHELALPRAARLAGRVTDGAGAPVADAAVFPIFRKADAEPREELPAVEPIVRGLGARTGSDGRFVIAGIPEGWMISLYVTHPDHAPQVTGERRAETGGAPWDARLEHGQTITGTIRARESGRPLPGATVTIEPAIEARQMLPDAPPLEARADEGGNYRHPRVPLGKIRLTIRHPGFKAQFPAADLRADRALNIDADLAPDRSIAGTVIDEGGNPIEAARISGVFGEAGGAAQQSVETDPRGEFLFSDLPGGPVDLAVQAPGCQTVQLSKVDPSANPRLVVKLKPAGGLFGTLRDERGEPIEEFRLGVTLTNESWSMSSDGGRYFSPGGRFEITGLDPGLYELTFSAPPHAPTRLREIRLGPGERREGLEVVMKAGLKLTGRITAAKDGSPAAGAKLKVNHPGDYGAFAEAEADRLGRYELTGLPAGALELSVEHPDYEPVKNQPITLDADSTGDELPIQLSAPARLLIRVTRIDGRPFDHAIFWMRRENRVSMPRPREISPGYYESEPLTPGPLELTLIAETPVKRKVDIRPGKKAEVSIELRPSLFEGRVTHRGVPVSGKRVILSVDRHGSAGSVTHTSNDGVTSKGSTGYETTTDAAGRFLVKDLQPGEYYFALGGYRERFEAGERTMSRDFTLPDGAVTGKVTGFKNHRTVGVSIEGGGYVRVDEHGRFRIDYLTPGRHLATAREDGTSGREAAPVAFEIIPGAEAELQLALPPEPEK